MSETSLVITGRSAATIRVDSNRLLGKQFGGLPALHIPFELELRPSGEPRYTLLRLAGRLRNPAMGDFASFEYGPLAEVSSSSTYPRHRDAYVILDRHRVRRFEDERRGSDAHIQLAISCLVWCGPEIGFEVPEASLDIVVPRSHWVEKVLSVWSLSSIKIIEIEFPKNATGENLIAAYAKLDVAERLLASGQWKHTLAELYSAFEGLAKSLGLSKPDQQFFADLLSTLHPAKKESFKLALARFCDLLHLGRHEPMKTSEKFAISQADARFALTMSYAIFEYITPKV
jgi:hypothetical protein